MKERLFVFLFALATLLPCPGFAQDGKFVLLASTIGPIDAGIVVALEEAFEKETAG